MLGITGASLVWVYRNSQRKMPDSVAQKMGYRNADEYQDSYQLMAKICPGGVLQPKLVSEAQQLLEKGSPNAKENIVIAFSLCSQGVDADKSLNEMLRAEHDSDFNVRYTLIDGLENFARTTAPVAFQAEEALKRMSTLDTEPTVRMQAAAMLERFREYKKKKHPIGKLQPPKNE